MITALIAGARVHVEAQTRRALITQSWRLVRDCWPPDGRIAVRAGAAAQRRRGAVLRRRPTRRTRSTPAAFVVDAASSVLSFAPWSMPAPGRDAAGIEIDVSVGYGDAASDMPEALRQAIRMLVAHWYENRGLDRARPDDRRAAGGDRGADRAVPGAVAMTGDRRPQAPAGARSAGRDRRRRRRRHAQLCDGRDLWAAITPVGAQDSVVAQALGER